MLDLSNQELAHICTIMYFHADTSIQIWFELFKIFVQMQIVYEIFDIKYNILNINNIYNIFRHLLLLLRHVDYPIHYLFEYFRGSNFSVDILYCWFRTIGLALSIALSVAYIYIYIHTHIHTEQIIKATLLFLPTIFHELN